MKEFMPSEWVVDQENFNLFMKRMAEDVDFRTQTENLVYLIENETDPYVKMEAYWQHNQWIHDNNHTDVKDAMWDYIDGRR